MYFKDTVLQSQSLKSYKEELSLLEKKDQQIKRLQLELEEQRKRADNAVKMLENYKSINNKYQQGGESLRTEIMRRVKAQEQLNKAQQRNAMLQQGIKKYIDDLKHPLSQNKQEYVSQPKNTLIL